MIIAPMVVAPAGSFMAQWAAVAANAGALSTTTAAIAATNGARGVTRDRSMLALLGSAGPVAYQVLQARHMTRPRDRDRADQGQGWERHGIDHQDQATRCGLDPAGQPQVPHAERGDHGGEDLVDEKRLDAAKSDQGPGDGPQPAGNRPLGPDHVGVLDVGPPHVGAVPDIHRLLVQEEAEQDERAEQQVAW